MTNPYTTHTEFLIRTLEKLKEERATLPILELGCGDGSTPILANYSKDLNVDLITVDNNPSWLERIKTQFEENTFHRYILTNDWIYTLYELSKNKYSLVFIDQSPWEARALSLQMLKYNSRYVIIHDCDYFPTNRIFGSITKEGRNYDDVLTYWKEYTTLDKKGPPTLVGSQQTEILI